MSRYVKGHADVVVLVINQLHLSPNDHVKVREGSCRRSGACYQGDSRCAVLVFDEMKIKDLVYCASKPEHSIFDNQEILPGSHQIVFGDQWSRC